MREVLDLARSAVVTLTGMGSATPGGSAVLAGVTTDDEVAEFAARGAIRGGLIDALVTDEPTAQALLGP